MQVLLCTKQMFLLAIQLLEVEYEKAITSVIYKLGLKTTLERLERTSNMQMRECATCHPGILLLPLVVNIRLHHTVCGVNEGLRA